MIINIITCLNLIYYQKKKKIVTVYHTYILYDITWMVYIQRNLTIEELFK